MINFKMSSYFPGGAILPHEKGIPDHAEI